MGYLFDTNIVSLALKNNLKVKHKLRLIEFQGINIYISCITYFEIRRGFLAVDALKQGDRTLISH